MVLLLLFKRPFIFDRTVYFPLCLLVYQKRVFRVRHSYIEINILRGVVQLYGMALKNFICFTYRTHDFMVFSSNSLSHQDCLYHCPILVPYGTVRGVFPVRLSRRYIFTSRTVVTVPLSSLWSTNHYLNSLIG